MEHEETKVNPVKLCYICGHPVHVDVNYVVTDEGKYMHTVCERWASFIGSLVNLGIVRGYVILPEYGKRVRLG